MRIIISVTGICCSLALGACSSAVDPKLEAARQRPQGGDVEASLKDVPVRFHHLMRAGDYSNAAKLVSSKIDYLNQIASDLYRPGNGGRTKLIGEDVIFLRSKRFQDATYGKSATVVVSLLTNDGWQPYIFYLHEVGN